MFGTRDHYAAGVVLLSSCTDFFFTKSDTSPTLHKHVCALYVAVSSPRIVVNILNIHVSFFVDLTNDL